MTSADHAIIESDRADRWLAGLIQALVAAEMDNAEHRATDTYDDTVEMQGEVQC